MPDIEQYQEAQTQMPRGHILYYSSGRILVEWRIIKDRVSRMFGSELYDLGHLGRGFDKYPRHLVIDTELEQVQTTEEGDLGLLCTRYELVRAVKEGLEVFIANIDEYYKDHPSYYRDSKLKEVTRMLGTLNTKLAFFQEFAEYHQTPLLISKGKGELLALGYYFGGTEF